MPRSLVTSPALSAAWAARPASSGRASPRGAETADGRALKGQMSCHGLHRGVTRLLCAACHETRSPLALPRPFLAPSTAAGTLSAHLRPGPSVPSRAPQGCSARALALGCSLRALGIALLLPSEGEGAAPRHLYTVRAGVRVGVRVGVG
eukprot:scaffold121984_cov72-Phaeocystis_antarctica.AAC.1